MILKDVANDSQYEEFNKSILNERIHFKCQYHEEFLSKLSFNNRLLFRNICFESHPYKLHKNKVLNIT